MALSGGRWFFTPAQMADSEGVEGNFNTWTLIRLAEILQDDNAFGLDNL